MYASKENARTAHRYAAEAFARVQDPVYGGQSELTPDMRFVLDFLVTAERKLPTEASYRREEKRKVKK